MYRLYDYLPSGNGYKVRLVLKQLALPYELIELDIRTGATRTADFLAKNPNGRIPLLEIPGKGFLPESHAIIAYLAEGSRLIPADRFERADMNLYLAVTRRRIGALQDNAGGRALACQADEWMAAQTVKNPAAITRMLAPGFPDSP